MSRIALAFCLTIGFLAGVQTSEPATIGQGNRIFEEVCENCVVSNGMGFAADKYDCNCYYTCVYVKSNKLSSMASPWVSTKRCCPCGMSWSMKLLTCVEFQDKRSDCFKDGVGAPMNPCSGEADGALIPRRSPDEFDGEAMCAGYVTCVNVPTEGGPVPMPRTECCAPDSCFDVDAQDCTEAACYADGVCEAPEAIEDCEKPTEAPDSECLYMAVPGDITMFMGKENMIRFSCAAGTCWDNTLCACVATNNTAYNDCDDRFLEVDFENDELSVQDGRGNAIWAESNGIDISEGSAMFEGTSGESLVVGGLANTFLSNTLVMRIEFTLTEDDTSSSETTQCILGNCIEAENSDPGLEDTVSVVVERGGDSAGIGVGISLTYQDEVFMGYDGMSTVEIEFQGNFQLDTSYELWICYSGKEESVTALVLTTGANEIAVSELGMDDVEDSVQVLMGQSGFVFGDCLSGDQFEGGISKVDFWRECKPYGDVEFETFSSRVDAIINVPQN